MKRCFWPKLNQLYLDFIKLIVNCLGNTMVKRQVFELLTCICLYNVDGYVLALSTLECFKMEKHQQYRFRYSLFNKYVGQIIFKFSPQLRPRCS